MSCEHLGFDAMVVVRRLSDTGGIVVEVGVTCNGCGEGGAWDEALDLYPDFGVDER